jgi:cell division protein FtsB
MPLGTLAVRAIQRSARPRLTNRNEVILSRLLFEDLASSHFALSEIIDNKDTIIKAQREQIEGLVQESDARQAQVDHLQVHVKQLRARVDQLNDELDAAAKACNDCHTEESGLPEGLYASRHDALASILDDVVDLVLDSGLPFTGRVQGTISCEVEGGGWLNTPFTGGVEPISVPNKELEDRVIREFLAATARG